MDAFVCVSYVQLFVISWTVAHQAPLSLEFSRQEYWSGLPFPSPGDLLTQGSNPGLLHCWQVLHHLSYQGSPKIQIFALVFYPLFFILLILQSQEEVSILYAQNSVSWALSVCWCQKLLNKHILLIWKSWMHVR